MSRGDWPPSTRLPELPYIQLHDPPCLRATQPQTPGDNAAATVAIESTVRVLGGLDNPVALGSELPRLERRAVIMNGWPARTALSRTARTHGGTAHPTGCMQSREGTGP